MRAALAVFIALYFAVLFVVALIIMRVVNTAGSPDTVSGILDDAEVYDFVYDRALDAAISDITARGIGAKQVLRRGARPRCPDIDLIGRILRDQRRTDSANDENAQQHHPRHRQVVPPKSSPHPRRRAIPPQRIRPILESRGSGPIS